LPASNPITTRTWRTGRSVIERLSGIERVYVTEVTDGFRAVQGRGVTKEASFAEARRRWEELLARGERL
jgi:hypothetical protein